MSAPATFRFINQTRELASSGDWNNREWPRLWLYNLHYFDDLDAVGAQARHQWHRDLVPRWIADNPPAKGTGWEPYCLALRIVNWCRWSWRGEPLDPAWLDSLAIQVRALRAQLEFHLLGNHLWADAKALIFAGLFFEGAEARGWLDKGTRLLGRELGEQVLPDGGHFERSPMYHNIVSMDVLELLQADAVVPGRLAKDFIIELQAAAAKMIFWAEAMSHPDGNPSFFNDCANGIAPTAADLRRAATSLGLPLRPPPAEGLTWLEASGYVRAQGPRTLLIADVAPVGPDYIPGHAHADTLSLELSLDGHRVLVNTGTSTYEPGQRRSLERGTRAHNTIEVGGRNSSDVWAGFRVGQRARILIASAWTDDRGIHCVASHDGYSRLGSKVIHRRRWTLTDDQLVVSDKVTPAQARTVAHWWLHPSIQTRGEHGSQVRCKHTGGAIVGRFSGGAVRLETGMWAPEFGKLTPNRGISVWFDEAELTSTWSW